MVREMQNLCSQITELEQAAGELQARLTCICIPVPPSVAKDSVGTTGGGSQLSNAIGEAAERIRRVNQSIGELMRQLSI